VHKLKDIIEIAEVYPELDKVVQKTGSQATDITDLKQDEGRFLGRFYSNTPYGDA